mmetsp:Transcript_35932/g.63464  ORF Transcript_35932/g.63464 Transcript_35932/m.63464 type:complete len:233 (+) Transcript_35932:70-768(+)
MQTIGLVFACLAFAGHGMRVLRSEDTQGTSQDEQNVRALTMLLSALNPAAGFSQAIGRPLAMSARSPSSLRAPLARSNDPTMEIEKTYIMIKPDGVQRGLVGDIIKRFEQRGYQLKALKLYQATEELLRKHYKDLTEKKFFPALLEYMLSGPVVCMVWEGENAVKMGRQMLGATNPQESLPGTIRGDFSIEVGRNICHGSDSAENAGKEIELWFGEDGVLDWTSHSKEWIYE